MPFEVEQKYRLNDRASLEAVLIALGAIALGGSEQVDTYYAHPARDFAATDEALRIRRVGQENFVTYKGPKLDRTTKTRRELESPLEAGDTGATRFAELLDALGFCTVAEVRKQRSTFKLTWQAHEVEVALDTVVALGDFLELELIADESQVEAAKACLASLATRLELGKSERRGYLQLLLAK